VNDQPRHLTPAFAVSVLVHASVVATLLFLFSTREDPQQPTITRLQPEHLVWISDPRPAARGGGGTPLQKTPPAPAPVVTAPQPAPVVVEPETIRPEPEPQIVATDAPAAAPSAENANGQNAGTGTTDGPGRGPDKGPGSGGTVYGVGNGVTPPIPVRQPPPAYTAEAMRARLQGVVVLNCVVQPDGTCSDIRVTQSLDMTFGLDQQAVASAREWRFRPGTRMGEPVPVRVTLEIGFTIR
jgi:protein TonB